MKKIFLPLSFFLLFALFAEAGGGYVIATDGTPYTWDDAAAISIHPESGSCASFSNSEMIDILEINLAHWTDLEETGIAFSTVEGSVGSVDGSNYLTFIPGLTGSASTTVTDGLHPIIFDDDGEIVASVAGAANRFRVLGFSSPSGFSTSSPEIVDSYLVVNCRCLADNPNGACTSGTSTIEFTTAERDFTQVHEMGHFLNLDHTQIYGEVYDDDDTTNDNLGATMYPLSESAADQITPKQDDIIAIGHLYPSSSFASMYCLVTGTLLDADGNPLRCADVQAVTSSIPDGVAFVSGAYAEAADGNSDNDTVDEGECTSGCGDFQLYLEPGKEYSINVRAINSAFQGGSGISPCAFGQLTTIVDADAVATISGSQCVGGTTVALGEITTSSTGGVTSSGSDDDSTTTTSSGGCTLNTKGVSDGHKKNSLFLFISASCLFFIFRRAGERDHDGNRSHLG